MAVAGLGARLAGFDRATTAHAMGIAEYHGPRSRMMRCIDHPTMLKDGSGAGAMVGVQAVKLAVRGLTGAPAVTLEGGMWVDLGTRWLIREMKDGILSTARRGAVLATLRAPAKTADIRAALRKG